MFCFLQPGLLNKVVTCLLLIARTKLIIWPMRAGACPADPRRSNRRSGADARLPHRPNPGGSFAPPTRMEALEFRWSDSESRLHLDEALALHTLTR
jgi:hypothetical protein